MVNPNDRVSLTDAQSTHTGTVMSRESDGICVVKWDTGIAERVHESELALVGYVRPVEGAPDDEAYELDDPKHPTFRERLSSIWDSRPGK